MTVSHDGSLAVSERITVEFEGEWHGIERTILQSAPAGYQLYPRIGYRLVTKVAVYSS